MHHIAIAMVLAATLGAWVATAAHYSAPGDPLYWFKVSVNERVAEDLAGLLGATQPTSVPR